MTQEVSAAEFRANWEQQSDRSKKIAREAGIRRLKAAYRANPRAYALHLLAAINQGPYKRAVLKKWVQSYRSGGNSVSLSFSKDFKFGRLAAKIKLDPRLLAALTRAPGDRHGIDAVDVLRRSIEANPREFEKNAGFIFDRRLAQRTSRTDGPTIGMHGSYRPGESDFELFNEISSTLNFTEDVQTARSYFQMEIDFSLYPPNVSYEGWGSIQLGDKPIDEVRTEAGLSPDFEEDLFRRVNDTVREGVQNALADAQNELTDIEKHNERVKNLTEEVNGAAQIISFFDPELGSKFSALANGGLQIFDGIGSMYASGGLSFSGVGNVLSGISAISGVFGDSGPTADEVILDAISQVVELQIETLKLLTEVKQDIAVLQGSVDYLIELSQQNTQDILDSIDDVKDQIDLMTDQLLSLNTLIRSSFRDEVLRNVSLDERAADILRDPLTQIYQMAETRPDTYADFPQELKDVYLKLRFYLQDLVKLSTDLDIIRTPTFMLQENVFARPIEQLEDIIALPIEERMGFAQHAVAFLVKPDADPRTKALGRRLTAALEEIGNPALFFNVFLTRFILSRGLHYDPDSLDGLADSLMDQVEKVQAVVDASRDLFAHAVKELQDQTFAFFDLTYEMRHEISYVFVPGLDNLSDEGSELYWELYTGGLGLETRPGKPTVEQRLVDIITNAPRDRLLGFGQNLGLLEYKEVVQSTTTRRVTFVFERRIVYDIDYDDYELFRSQSLNWDFPYEYVLNECRFTDAGKEVLASTGYDGLETLYVSAKINRYVAASRVRGIRDMMAHVKRLNGRVPKYTVTQQHPHHMHIWDQERLEITDDELETLRSILLAWIPWMLQNAADKWRDLVATSDTKANAETLLKTKLAAETIMRIGYGRAIDTRPAFARLSESLSNGVFDSAGVRVFDRARDGSETFMLIEGIEEADWQLAQFLKQQPDYTKFKDYSSAFASLADAGVLIDSLKN